MPKIVNHEMRRKQIAEATWRVILQNGIEGATVRNIAKEANISLGALRHYFSTQEELLIYAMELVKRNATVRIAKIAKQDLLPKEKILSILLELVPTNEETMAEMEVWFTFTVYARHHQEFFDASHDGIYEGIQKLINHMEQTNLLKKNLVKGIETEKLYALIDGLALHALLAPQRVNKERIIQILVNHIDSIWID